MASKSMWKGHGRPAFALGLVAMLAACQPATRPAPENETDLIEEDQSAPANETTEAKTSILRPEVATKVQPDPIKPEELVLPFGFNGDVLDDAGKTTLDGLLTTPAFLAGGHITIRGHTDSRGYDADNLRISQKRAEIVRDYLIEKGVVADRITTIALGETRPVAPNAMPDGSDDPQGRDRNRRVEIEITPPAEPPAA
jgi:outer membrane protein OmpA-like peptidoglycan-associated protein